MPGRLTIVIPTYNRAALLKTALESALAQTSSDIEILVSDNGSADATQALLAGYDDPRLRKIRRETTLPRGEHGTFIFSQVTSEFVTVLSDDDWLEPEFAAQTLALFTAHPELSFVYTGCIEHYDDVELPGLAGPRVENALDFFAAHYAGLRQVSWCACVVRMADIRKYGPQPPERLIGDMFFWCQIGFQGPVGCVARPLAHYSVLRPEGDNESRALPILTWAVEVRLLAQEVMQRARASGLPERAERPLRRNMERYTARSLANQFLWARISGMSRGMCLKDVLPSLVFRGWTLGGGAKLVAALVLPRIRLRQIVLRSIAKMAAARTGEVLGWEEADVSRHADGLR
jgi:hypothetical protein